jgi:glutamate--cysteine ligase
VNRQFDKRLRALSATPAVLRGGLRGLEKESLRVTPAGYVAASGHPQALGAALTSRYITTDYSEALIEFITPPERESAATLAFLDGLHQFTHESLGEEMLWPLSMPCRLRSEQDIPLARYGCSNVGRMKTIYRRGLGHRYGRYMQAIAGVHFNYSAPEELWPELARIERSREALADLKSRAYLALVRNVRRFDWLLLYLFGASPAVCRCFLPRDQAGLDGLDADTLFAPHATSLRMSDIGYKNASQAEISISANSLDEYIADLTRAIRTPHPAYERIGVQVDGEYRQLNAHQLQIENEYYSTIRPKRSALSGERPTAALRRGGVEYVELRALDLDPAAAPGVAAATLDFAEVFLLYALLCDSPPIGAAERGEIARNHVDVARRGREPGLSLQRQGKAVALQAWAAEIIGAMRTIAGLLDDGRDGRYAAAMRLAEARLGDPGATPSARQLEALRAGGCSLSDYGLTLARAYREHYRRLRPADNPHYAVLETEALASLDRQCWIEEHDTLTLEDYLAAYYA